MPRTGRPKHRISADEFEKLCAIQCTEEEVAAYFQCNVSTIQRWVRWTYGRTFAQVFGEKRKFGHVSLRRSLYQQALKGQPTISLFLAKNHLGMADKVEQVVETKEQTRLVIQFQAKEEASGA